MGIFLVTHGKGKRISNWLLGLFFIAIGINLVDMFLHMQQMFSIAGLLSLMDLALILSFGPLIYFYARSILYKDFKFTSRHLLHFLPFAIFAVIVLYYYIITPPEIQVEAVTQLSEFKLSVPQAMTVVPFYIHMLVYALLSAREMKMYNQVAKEEYSNLITLNIDWLKFLFRSFMAIIIVSFALSMVPYTSLKGYSEIMLIAFIILVFYVINKIVIKGMKEPDIFSRASVDQSNKKYTSSKLSEQEKSTIKLAISDIMEREKLFLDPELSLNQLASNLNLNRRDVSQVINEKLKMSFHDFVNFHRIEVAKSQIRNGDSKMTILEVLYQSGFNSKSSFNHAFKKHVGMTPTEYRKSSPEK
ncbi:MAG: helix-turn-helix transcriptional regulator [Saprospiraceae bacterium]|nr:helix-turn-helix transcriptional regulator [Saprospiraceae bacterium]